MHNLDPRPDSIPGRLVAWALARAYGLTLCAMLVLVLALLSGGCASAETATRLEAAQARVEALRADPAATDADWTAAVLELAAAQELYVREAAGSAEGWLTELPASAEGGAIGVGAAGLFWLLRQRTRRRLEDELADANRVAHLALKEARARREWNERPEVRGMAGSVEGD